MIKNKMLELHIIQNFAPSNLNRNDIGEPKSCMFGGFRRARISSQCFKRSMRKVFAEGNYFTEEQKSNLAKRTKLLLQKITEGLVALGKEESISKQIATIALNAGSLSVKDDDKTEYLLFLGQDEIRRIVDFCNQDNNWEVLLQTNSAYDKSRELQGRITEADESATSFKDDEQEELKTVRELHKGDKEKSKEETEKIKAKFTEKRNSNKEEIKKLKEDNKEALESAKKSIPRDIENQIVKILDGGKAADLALFGRMIANLPKNNVDGASQVSHLISTHITDIEFDFFTALDEFQKEEDSGAGMLDIVQYNSACFYRYLNVDVENLQKNLQGDEDLSKVTIEAFIRSAIEAIPTGKQTSFATHERPSFVLAIVSDAAKCSLANAFEKPVKATERKSLIEGSIEKFAEHWDYVSGVFGDNSKAKNCVKTADADLKSLKSADVGSIETLISNTMKTIFA